MEKTVKTVKECADDEIDVGKDEMSADVCKADEQDLCNKDAKMEKEKSDGKVKETTNYSKSEERNGFMPVHHRFSDSFLKRKYSEIDSTEDKMLTFSCNDHAKIRTEDKSPPGLDCEQLFPMDASIKTLGATHTAGLAINSIINSKSCVSSSSLFEDRLRSSPSTETSLSLSQKNHTVSSTGSSNISINATNTNKSTEGPKIAINSKPSFMITDILSSDRNRKEREACPSMFTDPRLLSLPHRHFIDRPLTASSCESDPGSGGIHRYTDDSDFDDDKSDNDGKFKSVGKYSRCRVTF